MKLFPVTIWLSGFWFWYEKTVILKKKVFGVRNFKDCYQVYHLKQDRKKKNIQVFYHQTYYMFTRSTQCVRGVVDPPVSVFSLSLCRHPFLYTLFSSHFALIINNNRFCASLKPLRFRFQSFITPTLVLTDIYVILIIWIPISLSDPSISLG